MSILLTVAAVSATLAFASTIPAPKPGDACALLTPGQVSAVLSANVGPGKHLLATVPSICEWTAAGKGFPPSATLRLITAGQFERGKIPVPGIAKTPVKGVGDDAVSISIHAGNFRLLVRKGNAAFDIFVAGDRYSDAQVQDAEKALAKDVLSRP